MVLGAADTHHIGCPVWSLVSLFCSSERSRSSLDGSSRGACYYCNAGYRSHDSAADDSWHNDQPIINGNSKHLRDHIADNIQDNCGAGCCADDNTRTER